MTKIHIALLILLSSLLLSSCTMKGYYVALESDLPDHAIERVKWLLLESGFVKDENTDGIYPIERYKKEPDDLKRSFFNRNADYWVHVDLHHSGLNGRVLEIRIYNVYVGNDPKVKPSLTKTANSIETAIRLVAPDVIVKRSEGLTGIPFI